MVSSGMMICSFSLRKYRSRNQELLPLNQEYTTPENTHAYADVLDMMAAFCQKHAEFSDDEQNQKMFSISGTSVVIYDEASYRAMSFTIRSGAYGSESEMTNRKTKKVEYRRGADDADIKDFRCIMFVPKDVNDSEVVKGILVFQTIAAYGIKTITTKKMKDFWVELGLTLEIKSVSVRAFVEKLIQQGLLYKITLVKNRLSPNHADNIFISRGKEEVSYYKPQLQSAWLNKLLQFFDHSSKNTIYEIDSDEYEDIKIQFKLGGKCRTVALRYIDRMSVVEDIPDKTFFASRSNENVLIQYMIKTAEAYKEKMIVTANQ